MIKLTKKQAAQYKQKWAAINAVEREGTRKLSFEQKFHQTASLFRVGFALKPDFQEGREIRAVRKRWVRLKNAFTDSH